MASDKVTAPVSSWHATSHNVGNPSSPGSLLTTWSTTNGQGLILGSQLEQNPTSWWLNFINDWNDVGFYPTSSSQPPDHVITSDALGSWGCGAFSATTRQYFQLQWPHVWLDTNIVAKELLPMVVSAALWGSSWLHKKILFAVTTWQQLRLWALAQPKTLLWHTCYGAASL